MPVNVHLCQSQCSFINSQSTKVLLSKLPPKVIFDSCLGDITGGRRLLVNLKRVDAVDYIVLKKPIKTTLK